MKAIILGFTLILSAHASEDCRKIKDRMRLFCETTKTYCDHIQSCLVRKDSCVKDVPRNKAECMELKECSSELDHSMPANERCLYEWKTTENSSFCGVDRSLRFREEMCPGYVGGIIHAIAYGLGGAVDSSYSCSAQKVRYEKQVGSCESYRKSFEEYCLISEEDEQLHAEMAPGKCEEYEKFSEFVEGQFHIDGPRVEIKERLEVATPNLRVIQN